MTSIVKGDGPVFTVDGIDFCKGLYSPGSHIASLCGHEIYLSAPLCNTSKLSLKTLARRKIMEVLGEMSCYHLGAGRNLI